MANYTRLTAEDIVSGGRSPSVAIFGDIENWQRKQLRGIAVFLGTDFEDAPFVTTAVQSGKIFGVVEGTVGGLNSANDIGEALGVLSIVTDGTDNMENYIQLGHGSPLLIDDNFTGNTAPVVFEARVSINTIADSTTNLFVGLGTGPVAANYMTDSGVLITAGAGFIGFQSNEDDGDTMDIIYKAAGIAGGSQQILVANAVTLVADAYVKLGLKYDPDAADAKKIKFYIDGVEQTTYVTATQIGAATFPEGEALAPMVLSKNGTTTAQSVLADWIYAGQDMDS